jgi:hypothetical protein
MSTAPRRYPKWAVPGFTGGVLVVFLLGAWLWEIAHGRDGEPYVQLCSLAGLAYISSMVWLRFRA